MRRWITLITYPTKAYHNIFDISKLTKYPVANTVQTISGMFTNTITKSGIGQIQQAKLQNTKLFLHFEHTMYTQILIHSSVLCCFLNLITSNSSCYHTTYFSNNLIGNSSISNHLDKIFVRKIDWLSTVGVFPPFLRFNTVKKSPCKSFKFRKKYSYWVKYALGNLYWSFQFYPVVWIAVCSSWKEFPPLWDVFSHVTVMDSISYVDFFVNSL